MNFFHWIRWILTGKLPKREFGINCVSCGSEWVGMRWKVVGGVVTNHQIFVCNNCGYWWERVER